LFVGAFLSIANNANKILPDAFKINTGGMEDILKDLELQIIELPKTWEQSYADAGNKINTLFSYIPKRAEEIGSIWQEGIGMIKTTAAQLLEDPELKKLELRIQNQPSCL